jgi:hypothetical protein
MDLARVREVCPGLGKQLEAPEIRLQTPHRHRQGGRAEDCRKPGKGKWEVETRNFKSRNIFAYGFTNLLPKNFF